MSDVSFRNSFVDFARDGVVDKTELNQLKEISQRDDLGNIDSQIADQVVEYLDSIDDTTEIAYTLPKDDEHAANTMEFTLTPNYSESSIVSGSNIQEQISNISQGDSLNGTNDDGNRCCAGSLLNAHLLMGGSFSDIASTTDVGNDMTYENVHKAQENLYDRANRADDGITAGYNYQSDNDGNITSSTVTGEVVSMANRMNLNIQPLLGNTVDTIDQKQEVVTKFLNDNQNSTLLVGVALNPEDGNISASTSSNPQNHFVTVFQKDGDFYVANTGLPNNGSGENVRQLTNEEVNSMLYNNSGTVIGVTIDN